jgi:hypothetical protein
MGWMSLKGFKKTYRTVFDQKKFFVVKNSAGSGLDPD